MAELKEDKITPLTEAEATYALREGWKQVFGEYPTIDALSILWAQTALETGRWKSMHCFNWGNIKVTPDHDYCMFKCNEVIKGKLEWFYPPHPQTHFNAYDSSVAGATEYIQFLAKRQRYQPAFEYLKAGSPIKYCAALKTAGYFTADLVGYTRGVVSLTEEFKRKSEVLIAWAPAKVDPPAEPVEAVVETPVVEVAPTPEVPSTPAEESKANPLFQLLSSIFSCLTGKK